VIVSVLDNTIAYVEDSRSKNSAPIITGGIDKMHFQVRIEILQKINEV
jgi:hypothetical protein